uniref:XK-related protein n=1 Tax=Biomphalaria glabrata TaxID=6526 RepID=A0A2C9L4Q6_BIOGL
MSSRGGLQWQRSRLKVVWSRRNDFSKMSDHPNDKLEMDQELDDSSSEEDNDFKACFIDNKDYHNENGIGRNIERGNKIRPVRSTLYNHNGAIEKLVSSADHDMDKDSSDRNQNAEITSVHIFIEDGKAIELSGGKEDEEQNDFVDMALSRDGFTDKTDLALTRGSVDIKKLKIALSRPDVTKNSETFEPPVKFGWFDMLIGILSIAVFLVDIGTDIELAAHYFRDKSFRYGIVTAALIIIPSLITCLLGLHWYIIDYRKEKQVVEKLKRNKRKPYKIPTYIWFLRIFFTLLMFGPVVRVVEYLYCGVKSQNKRLTPKERKRFYRFMMYEDVDSCLLRIFESFLESAPQLTWQLYIAIESKPKEDAVGSSIRVIALLSSWGSLAISLMSYQKSLRNSHEEKAKMSLISLPFYFIWRASEIGGRVLCIAMFASAFDLWVFGPLVFHWVFMSGWLILQRTAFYKNKCLEKVFNIICGYVMVFCFLNLREGQTRFRVILFYFIVYVENFFMLALWFRFTQDLGAWFHLGGFITVMLLFLVHVVFQLVYYRFFHPTKDIKLCLPCDRYVIYSSICHDITEPRGPETRESYTVAEVIVDNNTSDRRQSSSKSSHTSMV